MKKTNKNKFKVGHKINHYLKFQALLILSLMTILGCAEYSTHQQINKLNHSSLNINLPLPILSSSNAELYTISGTCNSSVEGSVSLVIGEPKTVPVRVSCNLSSFTGTVDTRQVTSKKATISVTHGGDTQDVTVDNDLFVPTALGFNFLPSLSSSNKTNYAISGTCDSNLGDVTVSIGEPNIEKDLPCKQGNIFLGDFNVENISSHPTSIRASQVGSSRTIHSFTANNINSFVTKWNITNDSYEFTLPLKEDNRLTYNFTVDWGDGSNISSVSSFSDSDKVHTYNATGQYTITIIGTCEGFENHSLPERLLLEVINLGNMGWVDLSYAFAGNSHLTKVLGGNTLNVTNMEFMFDGATSANPDTSGWDTSNVTDMEFMFNGATSANPDTSGWDTSNVTDMEFMFSEATAANPDTSGWNFTNVDFIQDIFISSDLSVENYSKFLISLAANPPEKSEMVKTIDVGTLQYNSSASGARGSLRNQGWTINDGGENI